MSPRSARFLVACCLMLAGCATDTDAGGNAAIEATVDDRTDRLGDGPAPTGSGPTSSTSEPLRTQTVPSPIDQAGTDAEPSLIHDVGWIRGLTTDGAGNAFMEFDRAQTWVEGELASGLDLQEEVILRPSADRPLVNDSDQLRTYPLAEGFEVVITDPIWLGVNGGHCGAPPGSPPEPIEWTPTSMSETEYLGSWPYAASLSFDRVGAVTGVRFMQTCNSNRPRTDAEVGLVHDIGQIVALEGAEADFTYLVLDRFQAYDPDGNLISAPELAEEYLYEPSTDFPFHNENPTVRRYPVAPWAEVLETDPVWMAGQDAVCGGDGTAVGEPVRWVVADLGRDDAPVASLTFDPDQGMVIRVRFMPGC